MTCCALAAGAGRNLLSSWHFHLRARQGGELLPHHRGRNMPSYSARPQRPKPAARGTLHLFGSKCHRLYSDLVLMHRLCCLVRFVTVASLCKIHHFLHRLGFPAQVSKLHASDFFGEVALIEKSMRTATVIADTAVKCMSLTRRHFEKHLSDIKVSCTEAPAAHERRAIHTGS